MSDLPPALSVRRKAGPVAETVTLDYEARMLRRKRLVTDKGRAFMVDLPETVSLDPGDGFVLEGGKLIGVVAASESVLEITGDLARLAWHIGNRHTPCQVEPHRLLIREDHVLEGMLIGLGAKVRRITAPFRPEGGAYGHGRTMGHDHGHVHA
jgi:urease accessory protein